MKRVKPYFTRVFCPIRFNVMSGLLHQFFFLLLIFNMATSQFSVEPQRIGKTVHKTATAPGAAAAVAVITTANRIKVEI